jgi:hypothetical protein
MLFKDINAVYSENDMELADTLCGQNAKVLQQVVHTVRLTNVL